ncbi:PQQ-dependent sugar dehydrogenase [Patulibacter minatonensis]|uniref:PQQ-dependent sugar dehydrogenase n=1 Tax=Patulibacter minatonensis TaxID=298163 RepID=UPI00047DBE6A|nr:PQQ-dependent sugar dehydrogenase [Patulibacter minatonensis]
MRPGRGLPTRRTRAALAASLLAAGGAAVLSATAPDPAPVSPPAPRAVVDLPDAPGTIRAARPGPATPAVALTPTPDGRALLWAERGTGVVRRAALGAGDPGPGSVLARLDVRPGREGGIRGIAVDARGRTFASYVRRADGRLAVAEIAVATPRIVWQGPSAGRIRVGGGLVALQGGRLALAIGDQGRPRRAATPDSLLGRVVTLGPDAPPGQVPTRRSRGWHDPMAFARGRGGVLWVADRAGGPDAERIGHADRPRTGTVRSPFRRVPVALASADDGELLLVCGTRSGRIDRTAVRGGGRGNARTEPQVLPARCRFGVAVAGGRVLVSGDDGLVHVAGTVADLRRAEPIDEP